MTRIKYFAQSVAQKLVDDGGFAKMQQLVSNGKVAVYVSLGIV